MTPLALVSRAIRVAALGVLAAVAAGAENYDVVVVGGTPGGVAAAVTAARLGHSVALTEYHRHLGGMSASGLGKSDVETRDAIGGFFREFVGRVRKHYVDTYGAGSENVRLSRGGYFYEPSVAERVFDQMVASEPRIRLYRYHRLAEVLREQNRVTAVRIIDRAGGKMAELRARIFIDGTYEGDLAAYAGARYRLGRESRADFNELHAGVVYQDYQTRTFLAGTTGQGDQRLQAYTFRLCLTTDASNSRPLREPPPGYDRTRYLGYIEDWKAGRMGPPPPSQATNPHPTSHTVVRALSIADVPNRKTDVNMNPRPLGFPFPEENTGYAEAGWEERERITERIRNITLGLLWFLQNDPEVPAEHRKLANRYHLARDEFTDNGNFPWQLYVREARRLVGLYTLSENDVIVGPELGRTRVHTDSIAAGEFPIDSFPVRKRQPGHDKALEGYILMLDNLTRPYQIPYRVMVPETLDGLLVPVAASATHVAFSTIRLEPTWMAMGQAAGAAAHIAIAGGRQPRQVDMEILQRLLLDQGQVITYFKDIDTTDPAHASLQYFGTKGFFNDYYARSREPLERKVALEWLRLAMADLPLKSAVWQPDGFLTRAEVSRLLEGTGSDWMDPNSRPASLNQPVSRGEFCRALYLLRGRVKPSESQ